MLIVVRHGRTPANAAGQLLGRRDPELDELGRAQAAAVGIAILDCGSRDQQPTDALSPDR